MVSRSAEVSIPGGVVDPDTAELEVAGVGTLGLYRWNRTSRGAWAILPRPSGAFLASAMEWDDQHAESKSREAPMSIAEVAAAFERVFGLPVTMAAPPGPGPHQLRRWRGRNTRIAETYRRGRVLLAGDAAHVHNGVGAPGLNVALQDAACLAWRLAGALRGTPALLDGYEPERRRVAERVVMQTQAQTLLLGPGDGVTAIRMLLAELVTEPAVTARLATLLEGSDLRYPTRPDAHPLVGHFVPDLKGIDAHLDDPRPVLLDFGAAPRDLPPVVKLVSLAIEDPPAAALLVRPVGYVAWAADDNGPVATSEFDRVLAELTGQGGVLGAPTGPRG